MSHSKRMQRRLRSAAHHGDVVLLQAMLRRGADPNWRPGSSWNRATRSHLMRAVAAGHDECVQLLLAAGARPDMPTGSTELTPLIQAVLDENLELVQTLVQEGADLEMATTDGRTPLMYAVQSGRLDLVKVLLEAGANPSATTRWGSAGRSVMDLARQALGARQRAVRLLDGTETKELTAARKQERAAQSILQLVDSRISAQTTPS